MTLAFGYRGRLRKPRECGRTTMIDTGLPFGLFADVIQCHAHYVDAVKFGWATAVLTQALPKKIALLRSMGIDCWFGGTFFEIAWGKGKLSDYIAWIRQLGVMQIEVSDGAVALNAADRARLIRTLSAGFTVISAVGKKAVDALPEPAEWAASVRADLAGRGSGTAGPYDSDGRLRLDLIEAIFASI